MSRVRLSLKQAPELRVDVRGLHPKALAGLSVSEIEHLQVGHGAQALALGELFAVAREAEQGNAAEELIFEGDLSRFDRVGWQMEGGRLVVHGSVGDHAGAGLRAGELRVHGHAGLLAGCEMSGGTLTVEGDVGDHAGGARPGSMDGMRGGTLLVRGNAGARFGDRMRRGSAIVLGNVGDFLASRLVAGTIAVGGRAGAHIGLGMRRGSLVFAGVAPKVPATFVPAQADAPVAWQLIARDLARHGGLFAELASRRIRRHLGDLSADGKGELIDATISSSLPG